MLQLFNLLLTFEALDDLIVCVLFYLCRVIQTKRNGKQTTFIFYHLNFNNNGFRVKRVFGFDKGKNEKYVAKPVRSGKECFSKMCGKVSWLYGVGYGLYGRK